MGKKRRTRLNPGDILSVETPAGLGYVEYVGRDHNGIPIIRVLPGVYPEPLSVGELRELRNQPGYYTKCFIDSATDIAELVLPAEPGVSVTVPRRWRQSVTSNWRFLEDGRLVGYTDGPDLTEEQKRLPIEGVVGYPLLVERIVEGCDPYDRIVPPLILAQKRREEQAQSSANESDATEVSPVEERHRVTHYLYFPSRSVAQKVARRLEQEGYAVECRESEYDEKWLVLATHEPSFDEFDEAQARLEEIAGSAGGEYDGWETALEADGNEEK